METTLNIHSDILKRIDTAAKTKGISCSEMIVVLLKKVMNDNGNPPCIGRLVRYQERCKPEHWQVFHVQLRSDEYEYFLDLRKLLKMSVSLILAYAVNKFLGKKIRSCNTDNYQYENYVIMKEYINSIICWKFMWGYPSEIGKHLVL